MVKIVGKTREEIAEEDSAGKLSGRVKQLGDYFFSEDNIFPYSITVRRREGNMENKVCNVDLIKNRITIESPTYLKDAKRLAEIYEVAGEPEFTVKKDYRE
ncbi:MAG: hypothetical protein Q7S74_05180 [Nanoarchaeota archaeon]|nr:hypothetical protein [Nanoarchaeota archaeon]